TCAASRSASEYTATVRNPMRLAVRMTRHAISPRLAINNLWKRRASDTITSFFLPSLIPLTFLALPADYLRHCAMRPTRAARKKGQRGERTPRFPICQDCAPPLEKVSITASTSSPGRNVVDSLVYVNDLVHDLFDRVAVGAAVLHARPG